MRSFCELLDFGPALDMIVYAVLCAIGFNAVFALLFWKCEEFEYVRDAFCTLLSSRLKG